MARLFPRLAVALLVLTTYVGATDVVTPAPASAAPCVNDNSWNIAQSPKEPPRCINGVPFKTRRRIPSIAGCLGPARPAGWIYERDYCDNGVEAIGQARAIKFLSDRLETPSQNFISPNVQWEVSLGNVVRPDILVYNRFSAPTTGVVPVAGVQIIEAKVKIENPKYDEWKTQVPKAITYLTDKGMTGVQAGTILNVLSSGGVYTDTFKAIDYDRGGCKLPGGNSGFAVKTYVATQPQAGLLSIEENKAQLECAEAKNPNDPDVPLTVDGSGNVDAATPPASTRRRRLRRRGSGLRCRPGWLAGCWRRVSPGLRPSGSPRGLWSPRVPARFLSRLPKSSPFGPGWAWSPRWVARWEPRWLRP